MILWSIQLVWSLLFERDCEGCVVVLNVFLWSLLSWTVFHEWLTLGVHAQARVTVLGLVCHSVCPSVRLSVCLLPRFLPPRATRQQNSRYNQVHFYAGLILIIAIFVEVLRSKVMAWKPSEQANMLIGLPPPDPLAMCTSEAQEAKTKGVYRLLHAIYYCSYPVSDSPRATSGRPWVTTLLKGAVSSQYNRMCSNMHIHNVRTAFYMEEFWWWLVMF